jgi:hypothetical protein
MIITNKYGTVEYDWKDYKNPILSLNLLEIKPKDVTLQVFIGVTPAKGKFKQFTSQENFDKMLYEFPHLKPQMPDRIIINNYTQEYLDEKQCDMQDEGRFDLRIYALTANPPHDVMEKHNLLFKRMEDRDLRRSPDMRNSEEPCGHCWWYREKMMAFGMLDGQLK